MLALYSAALDTRVDTTAVSGYFGPRGRIWEQPLDRNVTGLLERFFDVDLATMVAPRSIHIDSYSYPQIGLLSEGGAPAILQRPDHEKFFGQFIAYTQIVNKGGY